MVRAVLRRDDGVLLNDCFGQHGPKKNQEQKLLVRQKKTDEGGLTKLKALADDEVFRKTASVCFNTGKNGENCGECYGCMKTMIPLDVMGKLTGFGESFDLERYYRNREQIFRSRIDFSRRPEASSARQTVRQIYELSKEEHTSGAGLFRSVYEEAPLSDIH